MTPKLKLLIGLPLLVVFGVLGFMNFKQSMTPYVGFAEAKTAARTVQVAGFPDHRASGFDAQAGAFRFSMTNDDGDAMNVLYKGGKPGNFDQAQSVVVIGKYDADVFHAKQILVKCPSKYEAEEEAGEEHPGGSAGMGSESTAPSTQSAGS